MSLYVTCCAKQLRSRSVAHSRSGSDSRLQRSWRRGVSRRRKSDFRPYPGAGGARATTGGARPDRGRSEGGARTSTGEARGGATTHGGGGRGGTSATRGHRRDGARAGHSWACRCRRRRRQGAFPGRHQRRAREGRHCRRSRETARRRRHLFRRQCWSGSRRSWTAPVPDGAAALGDRGATAGSTAGQRTEAPWGRAREDSSGEGASSWGAESTWSSASIRNWAIAGGTKGMYGEACPAPISGTESKSSYSSGHGYITLRSSPFAHPTPFDFTFKSPVAPPPPCKTPRRCTPSVVAPIAHRWVPVSCLPATTHEVNYAFQLLRDIDTPNPGTDTSTSSSGIPPPFQPQAASTQQHSFASPDVSPTVGARPKSTGNTGNCANKTPNRNFCSGGACTTLNRYLHHRLRRAVNLTLLCAVFCGKRRSRRLSLTKILRLKTSRLELSPNSLKLLPFFILIFYFISLFCLCSLIIVGIEHTRSFIIIKPCIISACAW